MKRFFLIVCLPIFLMACFVMLSSNTVHAATTPPAGSSKTDTSATIVKLDNPLSTTSVDKLLGNLIKAALQILGSLALAAFVIGGFLWLTSGGSPERVKKGTQTMVWAAAGVFLVLGSYAILTTIISSIGGTGTGALKGGSSIVYYKVEGLPAADPKLQVREKSTKSSDSIGFYKEGTDCVKATGKEENSWYQVEYKPGTLGWTYSGYLKKTTTDCANNKESASTVAICKDMNNCWYKAEASTAFVYYDFVEKGTKEGAGVAKKPYKWKKNKFVCFDVVETKKTKYGDWIRADIEYDGRPVWLNVKGTNARGKSTKKLDPYFKKVNQGKKETDVLTGKALEKAIEERCDKGYLTELKLVK